MSHGAVRIFYQLSCLHGCAVNLFNRMMQVKNSPPERRWGKGRIAKYKKFYSFNSTDAINQQGSLLRFFFYHLVPVKNHQPLN